MNNQHVKDHFLSGGGEMGSLVRSFDWSCTVVGSFDHWPQSLRTALGIVLHSKFPMFLWWGPELICFYNDAYRPSLGQNGKHPAILGMPAEKAWPEIWTIIKPLIDQVLAGGEATWSEDQLIPIYRNGKIEDVYWTFSYSPVNDESGKVGGVLVTCSETTEKVNTFKSLEESNRRYLNNIMQAPVAMCVLRGKDNVVEIANGLMLELWGKSAEEVMKKPVFEGVPEAKEQGIESILDDVFTTGEKFVVAERSIMLLRNGKIVTTYIDFTCEALKEPDGTISGIVAIASDITSQVIGRKKIEESEERLRMAAQSTNLGTWEFNPLTGELKWSEECKKIYALPPGRQVNFTDFAEHIYPGDKEYVETAIQRSMDPKGEGNYDIIYRILTFNDKSVRWIRAQGKVFFNAAKNAERFIGTVIDITDHKQAQQALEESELLFKTIANASPVGLWMTDNQAQNIFVNDTWIAWTGVPFEKQLGTGWLSQVLEEDKIAAPSKFWDCLLKREKYSTEFRITRPDGALRWCLTEGFPYYDTQGNFAGYAGSVTDITERKLLQEELERKVSERTLELKKSEEINFRMINEVQDYAILLLNRQGIIQNWNKGAERIKGYTAEEIVGKNFSLFYTKEAQEKKLPEGLIAKALREGKAVDEGRRVKKDGSFFWASVVITALHDSDNNVIGFSKVTRDLTEIKKAGDKLKETNLELEKVNEALERSNSELEQFAYIASHDLQEPLRKIQFFSDRLEHSIGNADEEAKNYFKKIQKASMRMKTLITDLLNFSRLSTTNELFVKTDLNTVLENIKNDFELLIQQKNAVIEIDHLPVIEAIPLQMQQLFYNLVSNSLKFSKQDIPPIIKIFFDQLSPEDIRNHSLDESMTYYSIVVKDNGIGFEPQYAEQIFVIFQRLNDLFTYGGTGIGLAMCRKIILNHGGKIYATGEENKGASFYIILPAKQKSDL